MNVHLTVWMRKCGTGSEVADGLSATGTMQLQETLREVIHRLLLQALEPIGSSLERILRNEPGTVFSADMIVNGTKYRANISILKGIHDLKTR